MLVRIATRVALLLYLAITASSAQGTEATRQDLGSSASQGTLLVALWLANFHARIVLVDVATGIQRTVLQSERPSDEPDAAWSPDGRLIAVRVGNDPGLRLFAGEDASVRPRHIGPRKGVGSFAWSPDSRALVFTQNSGHRLVIRGLDGGTRVIRQTGRGTAMFNVTWSPDGRWISYDRDATGYGNPSLHLIHPDGSNAHKVLQTNDGRGVDMPSSAVWSPDGHQFAFSTEHESQDDPALAVIDADSGKLTTLNISPFVRPLGWSPDGSSLAVMQESSLLLVDASATIRTLATVLPPGMFGAWSRDGRLAIAGQDGYLDRSPSDLELVDPAGGQPQVPTQLPRGSSVTALAWRPGAPP